MQEPETVTWRNLAEALIRHRVLAISTFAAVFLGAVATAFVMTPVYYSEVLVIPAKDQQSGAGLSALLGKFGGLASIAGINLPATEGTTAQIGVEILKSRGFLAEFIENRSLLPVIFSDDWDPKRARWTLASGDVPTLDDGVDRFRRRVLKVKQGGTGGTMRVGVVWRDRDVAAVWANELVADLNEKMRRRAIDESAKSLRYLEQQLQQTTAVEVRHSIFGLMEEQLNSSMLANVQREYAFQVLDPATPADRGRPLRPRRGMLIVLGFLAGLALAAVAVAIRSGFRRV